MARAHSVQRQTWLRADSKDISFGVTALKTNRNHTQPVSLVPRLPLMAEGGLTSESQNKPEVGEQILTPLSNIKVHRDEDTGSILENNLYYNNKTYTNISSWGKPPGQGRVGVKAHGRSRSGTPCPWPAPTAPHGPGHSPGHLGKGVKDGEMVRESWGLCHPPPTQEPSPHTSPPYPSHLGSGPQTSGCRCDPIH